MHTVRISNDLIAHEKGLFGRFDYAVNMPETFRLFDIQAVKQSEN